jgi:uncharacterized membrane protein YhhN
MTVYIIVATVLAVSTLLLIIAELRSDIRRRFIFKPLSAALMITVILISLPENPQLGFAVMLLIGMLFCAGGDVALMFESNKAFTFGLVLFLIGHIIYTVTIIRFDGFLLENWIITTVLILLAVIMFSVLYSGLGKMKLPVLLYIVAITVMIHSALMTFYGNYFSRNQAVALTIGAGLFYLSDVFLAIDRFKKPFRYNRISLSFYFGGQFLIALSTALG